MAGPTPEFQFVSKIEAIAREAGALLLGYFHQRVKIEYKGDVDLVTVADRASEKLIVDRVRATWPGYDIVGEEGTRDESGSDYRWYIDPLDGTTNFAHGYPVFCVSMGLEHRGEMLAGVLYDPTRDELFAAEKGKGAYLNGAPIHVSATKRLCESLLATGFPSHKRHKNPNIHFYHEITLHSHGVRRAGSAALDLANVACGRYDGFWEFNLNPWDTSAGTLLVTEAGGRVTRYDGSTWRMDSKETLASNGLIHDEMMRAFEAIFSGKEMEPLPSPEEWARMPK
ncbi:Inositol-1(or 4)-monophosphatase [Candidatus Koribacter versatilis Ellin345]|uniref:Inositol-1-monophosphatase n=1 Tax=Koribacter versatilis (strain Ellin345) TaxID=204669 RepID=Q1IPY9_KORVE|nr:inositol monophosphatase family protein [Candidatus Koribacter versatilis]ABF41061.1 Inositol-1(or 4)-monophosphatase [Candidatus Koribacter versatilis Ellin345]